MERMNELEKVLEQILDKLNKMEAGQKEMKADVKEMQTDIKLIQTQQAEHGKILTALRHSSETHTAKLDNLEVELAKLSGEQQQSFEALSNMYGHHELEITKLKQVK
jgi:septation ring formation regulator EzrA